jgi:hypothetical protein
MVCTPSTPVAGPSMPAVSRPDLPHTDDVHTPEWSGGSQSAGGVSHHALVRESGRLIAFRPLPGACGKALLWLMHPSAWQMCHSQMHTRSCLMYNFDTTWACLCRYERQNGRSLVEALNAMTPRERAEPWTQAEGPQLLLPIQVSQSVRDRQEAESLCWGSSTGALCTSTVVSHIHPSWPGYSSPSPPHSPAHLLQEVVKVSGIGPVCTGRLKAGALAAGQEVGQMANNSLQLALLLCSATFPDCVCKNP